MKLVSFRNTVEEVPLYDSGEDEYFPVIFGTSGGNEHTKIPNDGIRNELHVIFVNTLAIFMQGIKYESSLKLNSVYAEIRPIIEVYGRENQDRVPTSIAKTWIKADFFKYKEYFDLYFSVIKNVMCHRLETDATAVGPSKGEAGPQPANAKVIPSKGGAE
ncbi:hypothetical protein HAX54_039476 [Datura stramonium]|uniref:Uncharacterized protein n=1 Tax=Datura stramonium TaxID=4076 RepID=A0ABS8SJ27_DATST|nr:hypothetical protein [Datura stramonium]